MLNAFGKLFVNKCKEKMLKESYEVAEERYSER